MTLNDFVGRAILVPYVRHGRSYDGWDCWGVIYCAYRDVLATDVYSYSAQYNAETSFAELAALIAAEKSSWVRVDNPQPMDVGLYSIGGYDTHVSLVVDRLSMLHSERGTGTIVERMDALIWRSRLVDYYRHSSRCGAPSA